jgi:Holliday junction resolvase|tara:strand:- start:2204 stop:2494 length:291 start_codon:yes stop_codon:yes gene_type:complete
VRNKYAKGAAAENELRRLYEKLGYYVIRSAGSKGIIDLQATRLGPKGVVTHGIQVQRSTKLSKSKRERLLSIARFGITPVEAYKVDGDWLVRILRG